MTIRARVFSRSVITPLMAALFLTVAFTGTLMLLGVRSGPIKGFHEMMSTFFVLSAIVHLSMNRYSFVSYTKKPVTIVLGGITAIVIVSLTASLGAGARFEGGRPPMEILHRLETAPLASVAPVLDMDAESATEILRRSGVHVSDAGKTIADIAASAGKRPPEIFDLLMSSDAAVPLQ